MDKKCLRTHREDHVLGSDGVGLGADLDLEVGEGGSARGEHVEAVRLVVLEMDRLF